MKIVIKKKKTILSLNSLMLIKLWLYVEKTIKKSRIDSLKNAFLSFFPAVIS